MTEAAIAPLKIDESHKCRVGMIAFLCSEVAFFSTLLVTFATYLREDAAGPGLTPKETLGLGLVGINTVCLLSSSATVVLAIRGLRAGRGAVFAGWMFLTILLGLEFLVGTGYEWYGLIYDKGLTIRTNMFGSSFYTLVGFHAFHVTMGLTCLTLMFILFAAGKINRDNWEPVELVSWYWHFVDGVWIFVLNLVYVVPLLLM